MKGKLFIDSNVLVYLFSHSEPEKQTTCARLIEHFNASNQLVWSTQVIQEFYQTMTKKFGKDPLKVKEALSLFQNFELFTNDRAAIENAIDIQVLYRFSFWDSLILSAAQMSKCNYLISEDLQSGQQVKSIKVISPFDITF